MTQSRTPWGKDHNFCTTELSSSGGIHCARMWALFSVFLSLWKRGGRPGAGGAEPSDNQKASLPAPTQQCPNPGDSLLETAPRKTLVYSDFASAVSPVEKFLRSIKLFVFVLSLRASNGEPVDNPMEWVVPFQTKSGPPPSFVTASDCALRVDVAGNTWCSLKEVKFLTDNEVTKLKTDHPFLKMPSFEDKAGHKVVVRAMGKVLCDGTDVFVTKDCEFTAEHHRSVTAGQVDPRAWKITLERKQVFHVVFVGTSELDQLGVLKERLTGKVSMSPQMGKAINVSLDPSPQFHTFECDIGSPVHLILDNVRLCPREISPQKWQLQPDGSMLAKHELRSCPFDLLLLMIGNAGARVESVKLFSEKFPANVRSDMVKSTELGRSARFPALDWTDGPFKLKATAPGCFLPTLDISLSRQYWDALLHTGNGAELRVEWSAWEFAERLLITVVDSNGREKADLAVCLTDSQDVPPSFRKEREERLTLASGELCFKDVYDWRHAVVGVKNNEGKTIFPPTEIGSGKVHLEKTGESNRVYVKIKVDAP